VLGYNWLIRRNKSVSESLGAFATDLHGYMVSNGAVKPVASAARAAAAPAKPAPAKA
jgi:biopolymer transport protein ExbB